MSWRIQQWNQERNEDRLRQSEAILNRAKSENRELTAEEDLRVPSDNTVKLAELNAKIAKEEASSWSMRRRPSLFRSMISARPLATVEPRGQ